MSSQVITRDLFVVADRESRSLGYEQLFDKTTFSGEEFQKALEEKEQLWERRLEHIRKTSYRDGYQVGLEEGQANARQEYIKAAGRLSDMLDEMEHQIEAFFEELQPDMADLVFRLAGKVLQVPVERQELKEQVSGEIQQVLRELTDKTQVVVSVSASDYETVEPLLRRAGNKGYIEISLHHDLKPGEYRIETQSEVVERSFAKILDQLNESYQLAGSKKLIGGNDESEEDNDAEVPR